MPGSACISRHARLPRAPVIEETRFVPSSREMHAIFAAARSG